MKDAFITITGAREHNLRCIDLKIPRNKFIVITGVSGSGKSSLAFDTLYAEGQRRYVESLSAYARHFLEQMQKPDVESIEGLPPTISIEQRTGHSTPRSTVATSTEIYDYLRLLFARIGNPFCYKCSRPISQQTPQQMIDNILQLKEGQKIILLSPVVRGKKGSHKEVLDNIKKQGFVRVRVNGQMKDIKDMPTLNKNQKHDIDVVIDRIVMAPDVKSRLADSVELALRVSNGLLNVSWEEDGKAREKLYSQLFSCPLCNVSFGEIQPRLFSFNSPYGACQTCDGLGTRLELDEDLMVPDKSRSFRDGAIEILRRLGRRSAVRYAYKLREFCQMFNISFLTPYQKISPDKRRILMHGTTDKENQQYGCYFDGIVPHLMYRFQNTESDFIKRRILMYMSELPCPSCQGRRLRPEALSVKIADKDIHEITLMTIEKALKFFEDIQLDKEQQHIARLVLKEIRSRLRFLCDVGLSYLTLERKSETLAGGEAQRIRLASQLGSGLVGVCYILDEPTIGLHQRDNKRMLDSLFKLRDLGNTIIVVEHDEDTIRSADYLIDMGPGAGRHGGEVIAAGAIDEIISCARSITGRYLSGDESIEVPLNRREVTPQLHVEVIGAREHNLKNINVRFPLGVFTCVTGVSGSGKSTLVHEILYKALRRIVHDAKEKSGVHSEIKGAANLQSVKIIDQSPIGRTPRSNPATYTGVFDEIRKFYGMLKESRARGYTQSRFSFNLKGGRCEACQGEGVKVIEMHFLPDVYVTCEQCKGKRYNRETLEITYKGKNISDILNMSVEEAMVFFSAHPKIVQWLRTLDEVGLGYMALGQPSTTLSGGEAQRVKLASELGRVSRGHTLYILDEPTTGLHLDDIKKLLKVLNQLVDMNNTVIVIEHNVHVTKTADWIIDLGPEGGERGGEVIASGTPEEVADNPGSYTGAFLKKYLRPQTVKTQVEPVET